MAESMIIKAIEELSVLSKGLDPALAQYVEAFQKIPQVGTNNETFETIQNLRLAVPVSLKNESSAIAELFPAIAFFFNPQDQHDEGVKREAIKSYIDSSQFYLDRVRRDLKELVAGEKKEATIAWIKGIEQVYKNLFLEKPKYPAPSTKKQPSTMAQPKVELQGNRWFIVGVRDCKDEIVVDASALNQSVFIEDCHRVKIRINNKVTAISANKCTQLQLTVDRVVSNVEMLSCGRSEVHLIGTVPTLVIDNSEGIQVYLGSEDSRRVNLFTSKCSEINVCLPSQSENRADIVELAVPVQFKTWVDQSNCLQTEPVKYAG